MSNKKKERNFNEGFTITEDGVDKGMIELLIKYHNLNKGGFSFVKVSNLQYR